MTTMTPQTIEASASDAELWRLVLQGNTSAFEVLVRRHQSMVSAVAYSTCGNLALSEDVAQETFWTAWRQRASAGATGTFEFLAVRDRAESRQERPSHASLAVLLLRSQPSRPIPDTSAPLGFSVPTTIAPCNDA